MLLAQYPAVILNFCAKPIVAVKIVKEVFIRLEFEICSTDFQRDDLFIRQRWWKPTTPECVSCFHSFVSFDYQTINGNDKTVSVH
jgi:hypothetical protein